MEDFKKGDFVTVSSSFCGGGIKGYFRIDSVEKSQFGPRFTLTKIFTTTFAAAKEEQLIATGIFMKKIDIVKLKKNLEQHMSAVTFLEQHADK